MSVSDLLVVQDYVCTRSQLLQLGVTDGYIRHRVERGLWRVLSHGVYLAHPASPSEAQRVRAAALACGPAGQISGRVAMQRQGVRIEGDNRIQVLLPLAKKKHSTALYQPIRSRWVPAPVVIAGVPYAPLPLATIHACRGLVSIREVRATLAAPVQQRKCSAADLIGTAHRAGRVRALVQEGLREIRDGVRSVPEGDLRTLILKAGLPLPYFNPVLYDSSGALIGCPDAYWESQGVALEVESKEYHFTVEGWQRTMDRRSHMSSHGILVVQAAPSKIRDAGMAVMGDVHRALQTGSGRPHLGISVGMPRNGC